MPSDLVYTPAAGHHWLTPVYDFGVAALTREHRWRSALIKQVRPRAGDVIADIGCGTGSVLVRLGNAAPSARSDEHTSELQSLMRISYSVFCWKKKNI